MQCTKCLISVEWHYLTKKSTKKISAVLLNHALNTYFRLPSQGTYLNLNPSFKIWKIFRTVHLVWLLSNIGETISQIMISNNLTALNVIKVFSEKSINIVGFMHVLNKLSYTPHLSYFDSSKLTWCLVDLASK